MKKTRTVKFNSLKTLALVAVGGLASQFAIGQCVAPPSGLVGWWPGEGNFQDIAGTNNGTGMGGVGFAPGMVGQAFNCNGTNAFVDMGNKAAFNLPQFTVETWAFLDPEVLGIGNRVLMAKGPLWSCAGGFALCYYDLPTAGSTNTLLFDVSQECDVHSTPTLQNAVPVAGWYHVAGTFDGQVARLYVNGVLAGTGPQISGVGFNSYPLRIGAGNLLEHDGIPDRFKGRIDEASLYSRALAGNEIAAIYAAGSAGKCRPLAITAQPHSQVGYWGKSVTFSVVATSVAPPVMYQWQHDGTPVPDGTNATLVLANLQSTNAGTYTVVVSDSAGRSLTSDPATLTVNPAGVSIAIYAGVTIDGVVGLTYGIQSTLDLSNTNSWVGRTNITLTTPTFLWYDSQPATQPQTYYRVVPGQISIP
jgi:hypothetical protein